jgi:hypothetical protein
MKLPSSFRSQGLVLLRFNGARPEAKRSLYRRDLLVSLRVGELYRPRNGQSCRGGSGVIGPGPETGPGGMARYSSPG